MSRLPYIVLAWSLAVGGAHASDAPDLAALKQAARQGRRDAAAHSAYGQALVEAGKFKQAERALKTASRLDKDSADGLYRLVAIDFARGDYRRSRNKCRALEARHPASVLGNVCMARAFLAWRRASRADEFLQLAASSDPSHVEVLLATADVRRVQGKSAEALAAYGKVIAAHPTMGRAHRGLGLLHLATGDRTRAAEALRLAVTHSPYNVQALFELAGLLQGKEAVAIIERALELKPRWPEAKMMLSQAKLDAGDAEAAEAMFRKLLKDKRFGARAQMGLGMALLARGELVPAEEGLKAGLALLPHSPKANFALAELYERTERHEEAFEQYRLASAAQRHSTRALMSAAQLAVKLSRKVLASAFLRKVIERTPKHSVAHALYGDLLAARGDREAARSHYQQALAGEGEIDREAVTGKLAAMP